MREAPVYALTSAERAGQGDQKSGGVGGVTQLMPLAPHSHSIVPGGLLVMS